MKSASSSDTSNTTMTAPQLTYQLGVWGMFGYALGAVGLLLFALHIAEIQLQAAENAPEYGWKLLAGCVHRFRSAIG